VGRLLAGGRLGRARIGLSLHLLIGVQQVLLAATGRVAALIDSDLSPQLMELLVLQRLQLKTPNLNHLKVQALEEVVEASLVPEVNF